MRLHTLTPPVGPGDHVAGPPDAPLTLVEYGDFECPYCGAAYPVVHSIQRRLADSLRFVFRHFPLVQVHTHAEHAAEAAEAAGHHGRFWPMHDLLFEHQDALDDPSLGGYAAVLGIDPGWTAMALRTQMFREKVRDDYTSGLRSGVDGTPSFFINGVRYEGPYDEASLLVALERTPHRAHA
jgi:protein-disulfide isomerase